MHYTWFTSYAYIYSPPWNISVQFSYFVVEYGNVIVIMYIHCVKFIFSPQIDVRK